jgi:hypothetical protein
MSTKKLVKNVSVETVAEETHQLTKKPNLVKITAKNSVQPDHMLIDFTPEAQQFLSQLVQVKNTRGCPLTCAADDWAKCKRQETAREHSRSGIIDTRS